MKISDLAGGSPKSSLAVIITDAGAGGGLVGEYQPFPIGSKLCIDGDTKINEEKGISVGKGKLVPVTEKVQGSNATWIRLTCEHENIKYSTTLKQLSHNTIPFGVSVDKWQEVLAEHPELKQRSTKEVLVRDLVDKPLVLKERFEVDRNDGSHASIEVWGE